MNTVTVALIALRGLASVFTLQGQPKISEGLLKAANAVESGADVDQHLQTVADALAAGTEADWDDIIDRINQEADAFLADDSAPE